MNISRKRVTALAGLVFLIAVVLYWLYPQETGREREAGSGYIYDKSDNITYDDVKKARRPLPRVAGGKTTSDGGAGPRAGAGEGPEPADAIDIREIFSEALINSHTTARYFKHLESRFKDSVNLGDHLEQVREYLFSEFSAPEAQQLYETYQKYIECEIALGEAFQSFGLIRTPEDALDALKQIQAFRRERLGEALADQLFGADVKAREYAFRRAVIVGDDDLYGSEKEAMLRELNTDMWGDEADAVEAHPGEYTRYREKMKIYEKDLAELPSAEARQEKIDEFRAQFFPPEAIERLEAVDRQLAREKQQEESYRESEAAVRENPDLTEAQKETTLRQLQDEIFGDQAEAFRRSETMRIEREKLMEEHQGKGIQSR